MRNKKHTVTQVLQPAKRLEKRKIKDLRQYDRQDAMFHPLCGEAFEGLKRDIQKSGLISPIEITVDDMIIDGHQRLRVATDLGWTEVDVWVRDDLTGSQIELRHLEVNRNRRQLDTLDQVRLAVRTFELQKGCEPGGLCQWQTAEMKKTVAAAIDKTPRHTQRLLNVILAPMEVQRAFSKGCLRIDLAERVYRLRNDLQMAIAAEIGAGGDPTEIVKVHLSYPAPKNIDLGKALGKLVNGIEEGMTQIAGEEAQVNRTVEELAHDVDVLQRFAKFSPRLLRRLKCAQTKHARLNEKIIKEIADANRDLGQRNKGMR